MWKILIRAVLKIMLHSFWIYKTQPQENETEHKDETKKRHTYTNFLSNCEKVEPFSQARETYNLIDNNLNKVEKEIADIQQDLKNTRTEWREWLENTAGYVMKR